MNLDLYTLRNILAIVLAATAAFIIFRLTRDLHFESGAAHRVSSMLDERNQSAFDRYGERWIKTSPANLSDQLRWAQLEGRFTGWTVGGLLARSIVFGGVALIYLLVTRPGVVFWAVLPLAVYFPILRVQNAASDTRKNVQRVIPEAATVMAAEMSAGSSPEQAMNRLAEIPGPLGVILHQAVSEIHKSSRPAFSRGTALGVAAEILTAYHMQELTHFVAQLDRVAVRGVESARIMGEVARGMARDYKAQVQMAAANLDNQLLAPMTFFFFLPFMAAILLPLMVALFSAF